MASSFLCECGRVIRKNLFSGDRVAFLVEEALLDQNPPPASAEALAEQLVMKSPLVLRCDGCSRLYVGDPFGKTGTRVYRLEAGAARDPSV